jgi:hypothetical protein
MGNPVLALWIDPPPQLKKKKGVQGVNRYIPDIN